MSCVQKISLIHNSHILRTLHDTYTCLPTLICDANPHEILVFRMADVEVLFKPMHFPTLNRLHKSDVYTEWLPGG